MPIFRSFPLHISLFSLQFVAASTPSDKAGGKGFVISTPILIESIEKIPLYHTSMLPAVDTPFRTFATEPGVHNTPMLVHLQKRYPTLAQETLPIRLHKRAPVTNGEDASINEPLLKNKVEAEPSSWRMIFKRPFKALNDKYQEHLDNQRAKIAHQKALHDNQRAKIAHEEAIANAMDYRYQIPGANVLEKDLKAKQKLKFPYLHKAYYARQRLEAVKNGNPSAAREVYLFHKDKSYGLYTQDGKLNKEHPNFASLYKHKAKSTTWDMKSKDLIAKDYGTSELRWREEREDEKEIKKMKKPRVEVHRGRLHVRHD